MQRIFIAIVLMAVMVALSGPPPVVAAPPRTTVIIALNPFHVCPCKREKIQQGFKDLAALPGVTLKEVNLENFEITLTSSGTTPVEDIIAAFTAGGFAVKSWSLADKDEPPPSRDEED